MHMPHQRMGIVRRLLHLPRRIDALLNTTCMQRIGDGFASVMFMLVLLTAVAFAAHTGFGVRASTVFLSVIIGGPGLSMLLLLTRMCVEERNGMHDFWSFLGIFLATACLLLLIYLGRESLFDRY